MKQRISCLLSCTLLAVAVMAQGAQVQPKTPASAELNMKATKPTPTVEQILERYVQAIGGAGAWGRLTGRIARMTMTIPGNDITVRMEIYAQAPNKRVLVSQVKVGNTILETSRGFNGAVGWSLNLIEGGFRKLSGIELETEKRDAEFYREINLKQFYPKMVHKGEVEVDNRTTYCIEAIPDQGFPEKWYFDARTGLLARMDYTYESVSGAKQLEVASYEDYRDVDGIKLAFTIRSEANKGIIHVDEVKHNIPIEEDRFKSPGTAFDSLTTFKVRRSGQPSSERGVLSLSLEPTGDQISMRAELNGSNQTNILPGRTADISRRMRALYVRLQSDDATKAELVPQLEEFGAAFFTPIKTLIDSAEEIRFIVPGEFLIFPLDLLHFKGTPLYLQKRVTWSFERLESPRFLFSPPRKALIIEDKAINPEKCCQILKDVLPSSGYYNVEEMNLTKLSSLEASDLVLVSAHGYVGFGAKDYMQMGEERLLPEHLSRLSPKLVYLDSCALGASANFIQTFREHGTEFYVAPLLSNEAGNSSTKTIAFFFERLKAGDTPGRAMFVTRRKLFKIFGEKEGFSKLLHRAFPFRVYVLNSEVGT